MTVMVKTNQAGNINVLIFPLVVCVLLLVGAAGFGIWAWQGRQDYKNNVDAKITVANEKAVKAEDIKKDADFAEQAKQPLKTFIGPEAYGALHVSFPKTWSAYVDTSGTNSYGVNGYFYPDVVPALSAKDSAFALRIVVTNQSYSSTMNTFSNFIPSKKGTITAYSLPKVSSVVGSRLDGEVQQNKQGAMIILPLRDKTLEVWTEAPQFLPDFNNNILPYLTFSP